MKTGNFLSKLSLIYRNIRDQLDKHAPSIKSPWGFTLAGNKSMAKGEFEQSETQLFRELIKSADLLVNVGANIGYYCCHALSMGKDVIAIEPVHRNLFYLQKNLLENGWEKKCQICPVSVGQTTDIVKIWGGQTGASIIKGWAGIPESYFNYVPQTTFDDLLFQKIEGRQVLVVADIEGAEYMMLLGATNSLKVEPKPLWMVEIVLNENQASGELNPNFLNTFNIFFDAGYQAFNISDELQEVTPDLLNQALEKPSLISGYNFLFRPITN